MISAHSSPRPTGGGCFDAGLRKQGQRQQQPHMNKPNKNPGSAGDGMSPEKITEIMADPGFAQSQLPGLWQQVLAPDDPATCPDGWEDGIEAMYRCCETFPQHTELTEIISRMPRPAKNYPSWALNRAYELLRQATPEQLLQALDLVQDPDAWWEVSDQILEWATVGQLTGPVIERLVWCDDWNDVPYPGGSWEEAGYPDGPEPRWRHVVEYVQQTLLGGDVNAWELLLGIVSDGTLIGDAAKLAAAIEHSTGPA